MRRDPRAPVLISRFLVRHRTVLAGALVCALFGCDDPTSTTPAAPQPAMLRVTGATGYLDIGQTVDLGAAVSDSTGKTLEGRTVIWSSSNPAVAEVVAGRVTGRAAGDAYIRAAVGKAADSVRITVEIPVVDLRVAPDSLSLIAGRSGKLFVEAVDAAGNPQPHSLSFASSAATVAVVDSAGKVAGVALGSGVVTVTAGVKSLQVPVRVVSGQRYTVRVLGTLGGDSSQAVGINNRAEVVGGSMIAGNGARHPFLWRQGKMTDLGLLPGSIRGSAYEISNRGMIVGVAQRSYVAGCTSCLKPVPWVWRSGSITEVVLSGEVRDTATGTYYLSSYSMTVDVNDREEIVVDYSYCTQGGGTWCSIRSRLVRSGEQILLNPGGTLPTSVQAINNLGVAALTTYSGSTYGGVHGPRAQLWEGGRYTAGPAGMVGYDINDRGVVAGACGATATTWTNIACTWDGGSVTHIPGMAEARRINVYGDVLGTRSDSTVLLLRAGQLLPLEQMLDTREWEILRAGGINDLGQIAATGMSRTTGRIHALLLTPS